jgi:DNA-binding transcriptional ArsR family regulator
MPDHESALDLSLHAIADPRRRQILEALKQQSRKASHEKDAGLCAGDIEQRVRLSQPTISHHMAILTKAGLVEVVKQSQWRWYRRNQAAVRRLIKALRTKI